MKLVKVVSESGGEEHWINPDHILMVREISKKGQFEGTDITLREHGRISIKSSVADLLTMIKAADHLA
jgi:hypothetical protein